MFRVSANQRWLVFSCGITHLAISTATAKQSACAPQIMAVLMPMTSARAFTRGLPEVPRLSAASVWMTFGISRPLLDRMLRTNALTMSQVTVCSKPIGLPIVMAISPRRTLLYFPTQHVFELIHCLISTLVTVMIAVMKFTDRLLGVVV